MKKLIAILLLASLALSATACNSKTETNEPTTDLAVVDTAEDTTRPTKFQAPFSYDLVNNQLSDFDIAFLKAENEKTNKIYSPLSIKYTLKMLEEGANGTTKEQISNVLGDYVLAKYTSKPNMSLANALFVRDTFKDSINKSYINTLRKEYNAEVKLDPFTSAETINDWIKEKTFEIIPTLIDDDSLQNDFYLINALAIDLEWKNKFFDYENNHKNGFIHGVNYAHENYYGGCNTEVVEARKFGDDESDVSGMEIFASMDNYDIVNVLGEDNIRKTVGDKYREFINENGTDAWGEALTGSVAIEREIERYLDWYIEGLKENHDKYGEAKSIDYSIYTDDEVKVFAKDLKDCDGTTLQYIGIMPTNEDLDKYVESVDSAKLNNIIKNLKELKRENFKDGVITKINGFIPKFNFEYTLQLKDDLAKIGITDVFDSAKADLSGLTTASGACINDAIHKAKIEFTQDGIKAAAATAAGGLGAAGPDFDYIYEVPVEEIDLTFDKPYMFIIRDKATSDVWFSGTVYEPLAYEEDETRSEFYNPWN